LPVEEIAMPTKKFKLLPEMEGTTARWYAKNRGTESQLALVRRQAAELTAGLSRGARVLEIAPGPGYLAVEMARLGFDVTGLDISKTFVEIATEHAHAAGVSADFRQGDVAAIPLPTGSFDRVVSQAAFKNFADPVTALDEIHRVLRPGGIAVIQDMSKDASSADIAGEVRAMNLSGWNAFTTRMILGTVLRRRAYSPAQFESLVAESTFRTCAIRTEGIGLEVRLVG
jgi:ubiquinone/menaquinone biosynthesis C-methylase UbiE